MGKGNFIIMEKVYATLTSDKSKWTAYFLCVFLGWLGAHYFYVGRTGKGILYICTFGGFLFGWVHDMGVIRKGKFLDNVGMPLRK